MGVNVTGFTCPPGRIGLRPLSVIVIAIPVIYIENGEIAFLSNSSYVFIYRYRKTTARHE